MERSFMLDFHMLFWLPLGHCLQRSQQLATLQEWMKSQ